MKGASSPLNALPLQGITVVEAAEGVAGPFCGRMLAAFGADVIKVERPPHGDWSRAEGPFLSDDGSNETSALYLYNNTGKRSVLLDWHTAEGMAELKALTASADVFIEDWDLRFRERHPIELDGFVLANPALIELSVTPFGLSGPYAPLEIDPHDTARPRRLHVPDR